MHPISGVPLGDLLPNRLRVVQIGIIGSTLAAGLLLVEVDFFGLCLVLALFGVFWNAIIAQFDTLTLEYLGENHHRYSSIRVWGSIGFILMMLGSGWLFSDVDCGFLPLVDHWRFVALSDHFHDFASKLPNPSECIERSPNSKLSDQYISLDFLWGRISEPVDSRSFKCVLHPLCSRLWIHCISGSGQLWALGVLAEVVLFFVLPRFIRTLDLRILLTISLVFGSLRWMLMGGYPDVVWLVIGLQLLHAFTFGAIHSVSIEFIRRWFPGKLSGRGMALYSGCVFGVGGFPWEQLCRGLLGNLWVATTHFFVPG